MWSGDYHSMWDLDVPPTRPLSGWAFRAPHGKLHVKFLTLLSHQLLNSNSGWFPVVCFDRVDLHAVGVTSVTTSENTQALGRRSCNRRGYGILCCYSLLSSLHFHLLPLVICHIVIVNTYLALRIWDFCRLLCLHRLPLLDLAHIDWRQSEIGGSLRRKQRQRTVAGTCSVPSSQ